ncbi:FISUMP domain-containing protein [Flexithrix dorotheae]|uniref:FISUMP domain-containing protein n=1 Tax=Flexithrix dorotheae TaxID=70993 RepID=UPI0003752B6B|nr:FISUMP domain-containing protein [Flexithrix dorotheae]
MKIKFFSLLITLTILISCEESELSNPEELKINANISNATSYNGSDGAIDVELTGGIPPYNYFWSNGATTQNISGLEAGEYTLRVVFGNSGVSTATYEVMQPDPTPIDLGESITNVSSYNGNDGTIELNVTGGTAPYTYLWSNEEEGPVITKLSAGVYTVTVTDASLPNPITSTQSFSVTQPDFVCGKDSVMDVDGNFYPTVKIGDQCWTATNLRTKHNPQNPEEEIAGRFCKGSNCSGAEGAHYTWEGIMNGESSVSGEEKVQGIAPEGWHIPTKEEWATLASWLAIEGNGGSGTNVPNKMRGSNSSSGFDALNAGNFGYDVFEGDIAVFWSATENPNDENRAWYRLINEFPIFSQGHEDKRNGLSLRCIKD